jgi:hypothetical protein
MMTDILNRKTQGIRATGEDQVWVCLECRRAVLDDFPILEASGYRLYHNFCSGRLVIDHVMAGPKGVFVMEKETPRCGTRRTKAPCRGVKAYFVTRLYWTPIMVDAPSLLGLCRKAAWLSAWLRECAGETIEVHPLMILPGWLSNRSAWGEIVLVNLNDYKALTERNFRGMRSDVIETVNRNLLQAAEMDSYMSSAV